jgi:hypothetical protein
VVSIIYSQADQDHHPLIYASHVIAIECTYYHTQYFIGWDEVSLMFCLGWPWTTLLLVSASWAAGITVISYWCLTWRLTFSWGHRVGVSSWVFMQRKLVLSLSCFLLLF